MKIFLALLLTLSALCGATLDFRSGKILCAEISSQAPGRLKKLNKPIFELPETPVYAALTVFFDEGRSISLHDYAINIFGSAFHCIAVQRDNRFIAVAEASPAAPKIWQTVEQVSPKSRYTLYFALDSSAVIGSDKREILELKALFHPGARADKIPFENLGSKAFTPQARIPLSGKIVTTTESKAAAPQTKTAPKAESKAAAPQTKTTAEVNNKVSKPQSKAPAVSKKAAKESSKTSKPQSKAPAASKKAAKKSGKTSKPQSKAPAANKKAVKK